MRRSSALSPIRQGIIVWGITFIGISALCLLVLSTHPQGALAFAHIGTRFSERDPNGTTGYDGQFVYFIARDGAQAVPFIDGPSLRYQRILYPVVGRSLAFGHAEWVPWSLLLVNIVAHSTGAGLLAYLLSRSGVSGFYAFTYSVWIGNLFAVRFGLTEPLCFAFALAAIAAYQHRRFRLTVFLLILATLTKELGLVIAAGLAFHAFFNRERGWAVLLLGGPLLAFLGWWLIMRAWFGTLPTIYPAARFSRLPLAGLFTAKSETEIAMLIIFLGIPTVVIGVLAVYHLWRKRQVALSTAMALACVGFVAVMPPVSWQDQVAAYRVALPIVIGGLLFIGEQHPRRLPLLAAAWAPTALIFVLLSPIWLGPASGFN